MSEKEKIGFHFTQQPVQMFLKRLVCECGAVMEYTGEKSLMYPPSYGHRCSCGNKHWADKIYPTLEHVMLDSIE